ncbi:hypothetical protein [Sphingomonas sp. LHG3406-1]|uniref:hypothetical protein n=1 Tax=Sphingomonas sp. LHG3406-1 TaxID=2804617 RepID=UPI00260C04E7|nr:hypothetical protein [Sphingomonas sp. LHG3406-1]
MIELKPGAGLVVAGDVRSAFDTVDDALLNGARMVVSVLEATQSANMPAAQKQRLLNNLTAGINGVLDGRGHLVSALKDMLEIKAQSNLAPVSYGCPEGWKAASTVIVGDVAPAAAKPESAHA